MQKSFSFKEGDQTAFLLTDDKFHKLLGGCVETCGEETFRFTYPEPKPFNRAFKNAMVARLRKHILTLYK